MKSSSCLIHENPCHGDGENEGKFSFDTSDSITEFMEQSGRRFHALKNILSGVMLPAKNKSPVSQSIELSN
jgi:hypothetical protein